MTLYEMLASSIDTHASRPALSDGITRVTYEQLGERAEMVARYLVAQGVQAGDRVAFALPNVVEFADWYFGVARAGAVAVPLNPLLRAAEIEAQLKHAGAALVACFPGIEATVAGAQAAGVPSVTVTPGTGPAGYLGEDAPQPAEAVAYPIREDNDPAVMLFTSGTTSAPKAAVLSNRNLVMNATVCRDAIGVVAEDVMLGSLPLFHAFGQTVCLNVVLVAGAHTVMQPQFNPREALALVAEHKVTAVVAVPSMFTAFTFVYERAAGEFDLSSVEWTISGGAPLAPEVYARVVETLGFPILEGYGLSECSPVVAINQGEENRPGSVGTALDGLELGTIDPETGESIPLGEVGELTVKGHCVMLGYWNDQAATDAVLSADGVLRTGDMARINEDGYVEIVDRRKDLVIVGGENVYPREVEDVLYTHPAVAECAVIGVPDSTRGESVVAAVVLRGGESATEKEIKEYVGGHLASFKVPRRVWFPAELPKGSTGKLLKRAIEVPESVRVLR